MARARRHPPLRVYQNDRLVGHLQKEPSGAIEFRYDRAWLDRGSKAFPVSLSLPLREDPWRGEPVVAVFENLLPDSDELRKRVAEKVGAAGIDAYSLLAEIGRDCIGALQFIVGDAAPIDTSQLSGEAVDEAAIEQLLKSLAQAPLGLRRDDDFRISVAGAQEKTALLQLDGQWLKPHGTTPTTHLIKPQIGQLPNGIDLSNSVENEFYCLRLLGHLGLPVAHAEIVTFGQTKALVVQRFDRVWSQGRLIRLPQEDCCQALSVPPARKYQSHGGPGFVAIADLLKGADAPVDDHRTLLQAQLIFWLIGATDGHAKNFSIFLHPGGGYALTPLYDVLSAQLSLDARQIERKQMKLAMSLGNNHHYRIDEIQARHFFQTGDAAGLPPSLVRHAIEDIGARMDTALASLERELPSDFPAALHASVSGGIGRRMRGLLAGLKS